MLALANFPLLSDRRLELSDAKEEVSHAKIKYREQTSAHKKKLSLPTWGKRRSSMGSEIEPFFFLQFVILIKCMINSIKMKLNIP